MRKFVLPKPGQGPSEKIQTEGYLRVRARGRGQQGAEVEDMVSNQPIGFLRCLRAELSLLMCHLTNLQQ